MQPTEHQAHVLSRIKEADKPLIWLGSVRSGKTVGACLALLEAIEKPGHYLLAGYTYGSIERNVLPVLDQLLENAGYEPDVHFQVKKSMPFRYIFQHSTVWLMGASDAKAQKALQGMTLNGAIVDEVFLMPQSFLMQLVARLSNDDRFMLCTANKEAPDHWLKREWIDQNKVEVFESGLADNPHISKQTRSWYESLITGSFAEKMLENKWSAAGNPICSFGPADSPVNTITAAYVDESSYTSFIYAEIDSKQNIKFTLAEGPGPRTVSNRPSTGAAMINFTDKSIGIALSLVKVSTDDEELAQDLESVYWLDREKPSPMSPQVMACGLATLALSSYAKPIKLPGAF